MERLIYTNGHGSNIHHITERDTVPRTFTKDEQILMKFGRFETVENFIQLRPKFKFRVLKQLYLRTLQPHSENKNIFEIRKIRATSY